ncbi:MAG: hypothetical protein AB8B61_09080 [Cyclobacteriaceae bacterium]
MEFPCPDLTKIPTADINQEIKMPGDSLAFASNETNSGTIEKTEFPFETSNTNITEKGPIKSKDKKAVTTEVSNNYDDYKKKPIKNGNGLISKNQPNRINKTGDKNIIEKFIHGGKQSRKR